MEMEILQLLSAAGIGGIIGSLLTTVAQAWLSHKSYLANRNFQEKKEAYIGFLESLHRSEIEGTQEASLRVGHWLNRCELVGSKAVRMLSYKITETNPTKGGGVHPDRLQVLGNLKIAMRKDLGVEAEVG